MCKVVHARKLSFLSKLDHEHQQKVLSNIYIIIIWRISLSFLT